MTDKDRQRAIDILRVRALLLYEREGKNGETFAEFILRGSIEQAVRMRERIFKVK